MTSSFLLLGVYLERPVLACRFGSPVLLLILPLLPANISKFIPSPVYIIRGDGAIKTERLRLRLRSVEEREGTLPG